MGKLKLKKGYYAEPTAKWLKIIGDFLNFVSAGVSVTAIIDNQPNLAIVFIIVGALGKAITNSFTDMKTANEEVKE
jgi:hypothetical protein